MNRESLFVRATALLENAGVAEPHREARDLWQWAAQRSESEAINRFTDAIAKRQRRVPFSYIVRQQPFYGHTFHVSPAVLVPRPETEQLIEWIKTVDGAWLGQRPRTIVDCGTGSGAIAITLAALYPHARVIATDVSAEVLDVAQKNAQRLGVAIEMRLGNLLEPLNGEIIDGIVANLPYLPQHWSDPEARKVALELEWEPQRALYAGTDGLDLIRELLRQTSEFVRPLQWIWLEMLPEQIPIVIDEFSRSPLSLTTTAYKAYDQKQRFLRVAPQN